jgi:hypothetical protein
MNRKQSLRTLLLTALLSGGLSVLAYAQLGSILKGGAIAVVVDQFAPQIDSGINKLTRARNLSVGQATKVVPILSIGSGSYLGAVQVTGPEAQLDKVKAVAQLEGKLQLVGGIRLRALVPIAARSVSNLSRVPVSASAPWWISSSEGTEEEDQRTEREGFEPPDLLGRLFSSGSALVLSGSNQSPNTSSRACGPALSSHSVR